jgi:phospholipid/cholesterol/gamma-HCH transport system ATP-binding protein
MMDPAHENSTDPSVNGAPPPGVAIELRDLHKSFGQVHVLRGISLSVKEGTSAVVLGGSGTGKSVLIKNIVHLLEPDQGEVWVMGRRVDKLDGDDLDKMRLSIGYLFQSGALFDSMTVYEQLDFYLTRHTELDEDERDERIETTLSWVNMDDTGPKYPSELSGGQRKRIGLARAIVLQPKILLYDEPTTGLDPVSVRTVSDLIVRLRDERGITSIAITHDLLCAEIIADSVHFLSGGEIVAHGTMDEVKQSTHPEVMKFFGEGDR